MKVVLELCILMGVVQKPVIKLYWSTKAMLATPFYSVIVKMSDGEKKSKRYEKVKVRKIIPSEM